jgi:organic radical activating enzyme
MLAGTLPARCGQCRGDGNRAQSLKDEVAARWPDQTDIIMQQTDAEGATTLRPYSFDYRSSVCNLKCRICSPTSSTTAEQEARHYPEIGDLETKVATWDRDYRARRGDAMAHARDELLERVRDNEIKHLYWAGGEPLFDETHWAVMSALVAGHHAAGVDVAYNTNLTMLAFKGQTVESIWPHFRSVHVQASVDGIGEAGEYIRSGFNSAVFTRNLDQLIALQASLPSLTISLDITITSLGLLHLGDLLRFALERDLKVSAKLMFPRAVNAHMAVEFLPPAVRDDWCNRWMDWILRNDTWGRMGVVYDVLLHSIRAPHAEPDPDRLRQSKAAIRAFENARGDLGTFAHLCAVDRRLEEAYGMAFLE